MSKNKFKILIISIFCIIFSISNIYALDNTSVDVSGFTDIMIQNGVADDIGNQLLEGGFFGEGAFNFRAQEFIYDFSKNGHFYLVDYQGRWESDDPYNQGMYEMYVDIVNDLKDEPEMKYLFEKFERYDGINNDEYSRAVIERITMEIMNRKIEDVINAYKKRL